MYMDEHLTQEAGGQASTISVPVLEVGADSQEVMFTVCLER
jgi:hypothetical protein